MKISNRHKIYKVSVGNESTLTELFSFNIGRKRLLIYAAGWFVGSILLGAVLVMATPLRSLLPGYMNGTDRERAVAGLIQVDSLSRAQQEMQTYMANLMTVINTDREITSDTASLSMAGREMDIDSLIGRSVAEKEFVSMMEGRDRYNVGVFAPLAADGMVFSKPSESSIVSERTTDDTRAEIIVAKGASIKSVADGVVTDCHYSYSSRGYSLIIQHRKGFISRLSGLGRPLVGEGERVQAGQIIATGRESLGGGRTHIYLEMWRDGDRLIPSHYINGSEALLSL